MSDELRVALEAAIDILDSIEEPAWSGFGGEKAMEPLRAALAQHADDGEITREWLCSIGGRQEDHRNKITFVRNDALSLGFWLCYDGWKVMLLHTDSFASCIVRGLDDRVAVRRLLAAMGAEGGR